MKGSVQIYSVQDLTSICPKHTFLTLFCPKYSDLHEHLQAGSSKHGFCNSWELRTGMIKGFFPEMQELPDCFCPLGSWLVFGVQVLLCREMININYEVLGHWKLLVLGVSAWHLHRNEMEPESCSWSRKDEDNISKNIFSRVSFAFSPRADPLGFHHPPANCGIY